MAKNTNKNKAQHAIIFEAVALALAMEAKAELLQASVSLLGNCISMRHQVSGCVRTKSTWLTSRLSSTPSTGQPGPARIVFARFRFCCKAAMLHKLCKYDWCDVAVMSCGSTLSCVPMADQEEEESDHFVLEPDSDRQASSWSVSRTEYHQMNQILDLATCYICLP